jgi:hypothetical protein
MFGSFTAEAVTDRTGVVMFPREEIIHSTEPQETWLKKNIVVPTTTTDSATQPGSFLKEMKPLLRVYRLLGCFPIHMKDSGNIEQTVGLKGKVMEYSPSREVNNRSSCEEIFRILMKFQGSQEPTLGPSPEPDTASPHLHILVFFRLITLQIIPSRGLFHSGF